MYLSKKLSICTFWNGFLNDLDSQSDFDKRIVKKNWSSKTILINYFKYALVTFCPCNFLSHMTTVSRKGSIYKKKMPGSDTYFLIGIQGIQKRPNENIRCVA